MRSYMYKYVHCTPLNCMCGERREYLHLCLVVWAGMFIYCEVQGGSKENACVLVHITILYHGGRGGCSGWQVMRIS